ncbi:hypothetical protein [uncultured Sphingomonas sp.]|uniref:hypothetical protein n=1 Tax=uncultured Sphingomonas sp. TaxID=158754 RepID=UPI0026023946|nr:hypothetical protein [uncultured Sphingomonas sp.]
MRIVDRATFLAMPAGTVFAKYEPHFFAPLSIKAATEGPDFYVQDLIPEFVGNESEADWTETLDAIEDGEVAPPLDYEVIALDDLRDAEQLFAVFEPRDVEGLIGRLQQALADSGAGKRR